MKKLFTLSILLFLSSQFSFGDNSTPPSWRFGAQFGWGLVEEQNLLRDSTQTGVTVGSLFSYCIDSSWEVGAHWSGLFYADHHSETLISPAYFISGYNIHTLGAHLNFRLPEDWSSLYLGVSFGLGIAAGPIGVEQKRGPFFGGQIGYDYLLVDGLSIGPQIQFNTIPHLWPNTLILFQCSGVIQYTI